MALTGRKRHRISDYKFTDQKHSAIGIVSLVVAVLSLVVFPVLLNVSYSNRGQAAMIIGALGLFALLGAVVALVCGIIGYIREDSYKLFPKLGIGLSVISVVLWAVIYSLGANV